MLTGQPPHELTGLNILQVDPAGDLVRSAAAQRAQQINMGRPRGRHQAGKPLRDGWPSVWLITNKCLVNINWQNGRLSQIGTITHGPEVTKGK